MLRIRCSRCDRRQSGCVCTYDSNIRSAQFNKVKDTLSSPAAPASSSPAITSADSPINEEDTQETAPESPSASSMVSQESNNNTAASVTSSTTSSSYGQYSNVLPPLRLNLHHHSFARRSQLPIPIHDPTDDIDSDTPIYKSEENVVPDREAVLGKLSHRSSEDLLKEIYGNFTGPEEKKRRRRQRNGASGEGQITRSDDDDHSGKNNTNEEESGQEEGWY